MIEFLGYAFDPKDYRSSRNAGQLAANELRMDVGLEVNPLFKTYHLFLLPKPQNRYGHELRCEVICSGDPVSNDHGS